MHRLPKIVLERLKKKPMSHQRNRQSTIENRQSPQSTIDNRQLPHLEANLLAAFVERTLTERERTQVLNHLAQCGECRELVALTLPAKVEVAQLGHLPARWAWRAWPALRWGALAAALGAVAIVVALHPYLSRRQESVAKEMRPPMVASAGKAARQPAAVLPAQPSPQAAAAKAATAPHESARKRAKLEKHAGPPGGQQIAVHPAGAEAKEQLTSMREAAPPVAVEAETSAESQAGATAAAPKAESAEVSTGLDAGVVGGVSAPGRTLSGPVLTAPMRAKSYPVRTSSMAFRGELARAVAQAAALWTISPGGKVQRSNDGGKTWEEVRVDGTVTFRVIQAMGREVWAGGSGGALYHSSDGGVTWKRVNLSSEGNPSTATIVAIISLPRDLEHITIVTASGEQWTTQDGGQHWQREP